MADSLSNSSEDIVDTDICEVSRTCDTWKVCSCCEHSVSFLVEFDFSKYLKNRIKENN